MLAKSSLDHCPKTDIGQTTKVVFAFEPETEGVFPSRNFKVGLNKLVSLSPSRLESSFNFFLGDSEGDASWVSFSTKSEWIREIISIVFPSPFLLIHDEFDWSS